jgi:organic hydroperoxide reductase OsmC/OhrA
LDIRLSTPGAAGSGTNPEELFAAGWLACFESAIGLAARKMKIILPADLVIDAEVDLNMADGGYFELASTSPCRASSGKLLSACWMKRTRPVRIPKRLAATSTS